MATGYYILGGGSLGDVYGVVIHVAVPGAGTNVANIQWRDAVAQYVGDRDGGTMSKVPWLASGEQTKLDSGELYEHRMQYRHDANDDAGRVAALEAAITVEAAEVLVLMQTILKYWGFEGSAA